MLEDNDHFVLKNCNKPIFTNNKPGNLGDHESKRIWLLSAANGTLHKTFN